MLVKAQVLLRWSPLRLKTFLVDIGFFQGLVQILTVEIYEKKQAFAILKFGIKKVK